MFFKPKPAWQNDNMKSQGKWIKKFKELKKNVLRAWNESMYFK